MNLTITNLTTPNTWLEGANVGVDNMLFNYILIGIFVILLIAFGKRNEKKAFAGSALLTGVLAVIFFIMGLVSQASIGISLLLFIIGIIIP